MIALTINKWSAVDVLVSPDLQGPDHVFEQAVARRAGTENGSEIPSPENWMSPWLGIHCNRLVVTGCHEFGIFPEIKWEILIIPIDEVHHFSEG